ncbi:hypothetical protein [Actinomadura flavalba]|uniref:hypothetical protein n=1 Tax=Actinomadura flavalba TaxID=1120938 RepID=UPI00036D4526|nr:hypothetical protein [Actinomadura flavalba]
MGRVMVTAVGVTGADQVVSTTGAVYAGYALTATGGQAATVKIWDNPATGAGVLLDVVQLASGETASTFYPGGIRAATGIYVDVTAGAVEGSVRIA